jgi:hypothetical protein
VAVVFQWALPAIVLAFLVSLLLREVPLREDVNVASAAIEGMEEASFGVLGEPGPRGMDEGHDNWGGDQRRENGEGDLQISKEA